MADIQRCLEIDPANIAARFLLGKIMLSQNRYMEAVKSFAFCAEKNQHDFDTIKYLAYSHDKAGNYQQAVSIIEHILKVFDYKPSFLTFLPHAAYMADNMEVLAKYVKYIEPYPNLEARFSEKEWTLIYESLRNRKYLKSDLYQRHFGEDVFARSIYNLVKD